ncbi:hypothetical protein FRC17_008954 [Serendipita sp. 399]|nr:hypothetical protein FRC17_008954 [Serendipita sp. 399]
MPQTRKRLASSSTLTFLLNRGIFAESGHFTTRRATFQRVFSTSLSRKAEEYEETIQNPRFLKALANSPSFAKVASNPDAMAALSKWVQILHEEGFDKLKGQPMSMRVLLKMASNQRLRDSAVVLRQELKDAGIEFSQEEALTFFRALQDSE